MMVRSAAALAAFCLIGGTSHAAQPSAATGNWSQWRSLAVQDQGRYKPLDTLAREAIRSISGRTTLRDPQTGERLSSVAAYLRLLLDAPSRDATARAAASAGTAGSPNAYFATHEPDEWDRTPMIPVADRTLRDLLELPAGRSTVSAVELCEAEVVDSATGERVPFLVWADGLGQFETAVAPGVVQEAGELVLRLNHYLAHRAGFSLKLLPAGADAQLPWLSVSDLRQREFDDATDPTGILRRAKMHLEQLHRAYQQRDSRRFGQRSGELLEYLAANGPRLGPYPDRTLIAVELAYNTWMPMRVAAVASFLAVLLLGTAVSRAGRRFYVSGLVLFVAGLVVVVVGFTARVVLTGHAPVTNMYESVVFTGLGIGLCGLVLEWRGSRKRVVVAAAAAITSLLIVLAESYAGILDQGFRPLPPSLRSNFWLVTHVVTITMSYSAFALAMAIGNVTLGHFIVRPAARRRMDLLTRATLQCLRLGVVLLAIGTAAGGVWADGSWGRFWGWDPKEVWALITLLGYLAVLHACHVGWISRFGLAALSAICFSLVVIAWYGVNFVLGTGLHSYGRGSGGEGVVFGLLVVQYLYLLVAAVRAPTRP